MQHADHFSRILSMQEINKISQDNNNVIEQNFQKNTEKMNLDKAENNTDVELAKSD